MIIPNILKRRGISAARLGDDFFVFDGGDIVAWAVDWTSAKDRRDLRPVGYTSYKGNLVPVYDLATVVGRGRCKGDKLKLVRTDNGCLAFVADGLTGDHGGDARLIDFSAYPSIRECGRV